MPFQPCPHLVCYDRSIFDQLSLMLVIHSYSHGDSTVLSVDASVTIILMATQWLPLSVTTALSVMAMRPSPHLVIMTKKR